MKSDKFKYLFIMFVALFFFGGIPVEFGTEGAFFHGYMIPKPVIRVGLGTNLKDIHIRASAGMKIYEVDTGYRLIAEDADEVRVKGGGEKLTEKFDILLAHAKEREEADQLAAGFAAKVGGAVSVVEDNDAETAGIYEVRLGGFLTRGEALAKVAELNKAGLKDVWIDREEVVAEPSRPIWMVLGNKLESLSRESELFFIPANPQSRLSLNGRGYRGFLTLAGTPMGIVVVNHLNLEDYLKSVVPGELSPGQFGALEALKAQAVAARTYALKNLGAYRSLGFDLVSTPRSQLYLGLDAEQPLSTRAVEETRGVVVRYKGELINALYTSTCGGRTEDAERVFSGRPVPYLKGVDCSYDKQPEWLLEAKTPLAPIYIDGRNAHVDVALLIGLGIVPMGATPLDFRAEASFDEAVEWVRDTRRVLGIKEPGFAPGPASLSFVSLARLLVDAFAWKDRIDQLLLPGEVDFLLKDLPEVPGKERGPLALCFQSGFFPASARAGEVFRPVTRAELAMALARVVKDYKDFFRTGTFLAAGKGTIEVGRDDERKALHLANHVRLLRTIGGETTFAIRLTLLGGESVRWLERDGQVAYLEVLFPTDSNTLDRSSRYNRWQVTKTRQELEARLAQNYPIGRLIDVSVKGRGGSGRATEVLVTGTERNATVRGFQIRAALGLRDTRFVIDRVYGEDGSVDQFIFSGRGWGHGVGLCQVGAYGMAVAGAKYPDILKKYYTGVKVEKIY